MMPTQTDIAPKIFPKSCLQETTEVVNHRNKQTSKENQLDTLK